MPFYLICTLLWGYLFYKPLEDQNLGLRRANFGLFNELLGGILWVRALEGKGVQECWSLFKHHFLHAQDWCIPLRKK